MVPKYVQDRYADSVFTTLGHAVRGVGQYWESLAEQFLVERGLKLIIRNFSTKVGEIDLIMRDEQLVAFVEVRYRSTSRFGDAVGSITAGKQRKLRRCAKIFLTQHRNWARYPCRFDVIAYDACNSNSEPRWVRAAFE